MKPGNLLAVASIVLLPFHFPFTGSGQSEDALNHAKKLVEQARPLESSGDKGEAEKSYEEALAIRERELGPFHEATITTAKALADLHWNAGTFSEAVPFLERLYKFRKQTNGKDHGNTGIAGFNLALALQRSGKHDRAETLYLEAKQIYEKVFGPEHPHSLLAANTLAHVYLDTGKYDQAEPLLTNTLAIRRRTLGPDDQSTAQSLNDVATLHHLRGEYGKAEPLYREGIEIAERILDKEHPDLAAKLNNLAHLYKTLGQFDRAEPLYRRAIAIGEAAFGSSHPAVATYLNNLGVLLQESRRYEEAGGFLKRALQIRIDTLGPEHTFTAMVLDNLAVVHERSGDEEKAEELYSRAGAIFSNNLGDSHPDTAVNYHDHALLHFSMENYDAAAQLCRKSLEVFEKHHSEFHPETVRNIKNLSLIEFLLGDRKEALSLAERHNEAMAKLLGRILAFTSERERLSYTRELRPYDLAGTLEDGPVAATAVLRNKGIVLDSLAEDLRIANAGDKEVTQLIEQLDAIKSRLRRALLEGKPGGQSKLQIAELQQKAEDLEKALARKVTGLGRARQSLTTTPEEVTGQLPPGAMLIEFFRYYRFLGGNEGEATYGAIVLQRNSLPRFFRCGKAKELDRLVITYREAVLGSVDEEKLEQVCRDLHKHLLKPAIEKIGSDIEALVISPDDQLNFVSFATLLDEKGQFLCEKFQLSYVASGRDLLKQANAESEDGIVLLGNPTFLDDSHLQIPSDEKNRISSEAVLRGGLAEEVRSISLPALPGTEKEIHLLQDQFLARNTETLVLNGSDATESALRNLDSPSILHLATHGFFLKRARSSEDALPDLSSRFGETSPVKDASANPMFRSGIALTGAQSTFENWSSGVTPLPQTDGVLMAAEAADLDLSGTRLVTLSACETASGEVRAGEGVLGLRRGFVLAGAKNLLMTLWVVPDEETVQLMEEFYGRLSDTEDIPEAFSLTQRDWLVRLRKEEGLFSAIAKSGPFILSRSGVDR